MWQLSFEIQQDEKCDVCGSRLDTRMVGRTDVILYCPYCLRHQIGAEGIKHDTLVQNQDTSKQHRQRSGDIK